MLTKRYKYLYKTFKSTLLNKVNISNQGKCLSLCKGNFWKIELLQFLGLEMRESCVMKGLIMLASSQFESKHELVDNKWV